MPGLMLALCTAAIGCGSDSETSQSTAVVSIAITPQADTVIVKGSATLAAHALDANHAIIGSPEASWSSLDTLIATVAPSGLVTAKALGSARVVAVADGHVDTATVVSVPRIVTFSDWPTLLVGDSVHATAVLTDAFDQPLTGAAPIWSSGDSSRLHVSPAGVAVGISGGAATLVATANGGRGALPVVVVPRSSTTHLQVTTYDVHGNLTLRNRDGTGVVMVSDSLHQVHSFSWSADGSRLALWEYAVAGAPGPASGVYIAAGDLSTPALVTTNGELSAISPDGQHVAFIVQTGAADYDIFTAGRGGADLHDITNAAGSVETYPAWSPDGALVAYERAADLTLWVAPVDTGAPRQIPFPYEVANFLWSPDGRYLAVSAQGPSPAGTILYGSWIIRRDGTGLIALSPGCTAHGACGAGEGNSSLPSWAPDGKHLAFYSREPGGPVVIVADLAGHAVRTTPWSECGADPIWSPDGTSWIAGDTVGTDGLGHASCGLTAVDTLGHRMAVLDTGQTQVPYVIEHPGVAWRP